MQTTLADVLSALGAVPAGFRESTLAKLLANSGTCTYTYICIYMYVM